ncbi:hypothetical protein, conserved [Plasmodium gonderi]|uniref:Uncharacterized protein n=1 Tax=Plasmodium gonderi TaxID=77519 RepID=A0A1Y1JPR0_PLAGO|nr:hypothetical protein, conserved [Plasmodium gonderi]GAW83478.1 hypothetical protein, conserved [Plasmodium gonderi]
MILHRMKKVCFSSDVNISNLLRKKGILFENVKRDNCKKELILSYFDLKGVKLRGNDIHIMTNILCRPTGRIMILIDNMKKQNFNFDFGTLSGGESNITREENKMDDEVGDSKNSKMLDEKGGTSIDDRNTKSSFSSKKEHDELSNDKTNNRERKEEHICTNMWNRNLKNLFKECKIHLCDDYEIEKFVEECERFIRFTEDIKRIARFENIEKIVTIINIPSCYGRKELAQIIYDCAKIKVKLKNIIFRFKKNGIQSDCAYVLCNSVNDANILINKMQEYPVAKKYHLREFYGTAFLYASKNNLFLSSEKLDYITIFSKYKIFTCGWHKDITIKEFESFLITLKIFPKKIIKINYNRKIIGSDNTSVCIQGQGDGSQKQSIGESDPKHELSTVDSNHILINIYEMNPSSMETDETTNTTSSANSTDDMTDRENASDTNTSSFILFFENMRMTKKVFTKLERLKKKWKISTSKNFYAYPKVPDIHFNDDEDYDDENEYEDSDLDEEIEY